jgi:hypothetical protein
MAAQRATVPQLDATGIELGYLESFPRLRALAWQNDWLYASRGYTLFRARFGASRIEWQPVGEYRPAWWRNVSSASRLGFRLFRDGFHALAVLSTGQLVASVPGAIVTLAPGESEFRVSHELLRGTRPLHIAVAPDDCIFWGEYFSNASRDEVHVYASSDRGNTWNIAYTFPAHSIRHVHNIVYDPWRECLWLLTGDNADECRILRASSDFKNVDMVLFGKQQFRAVALIPTEHAVYFSTDTPFESNSIYVLDSDSVAAPVAKISSSSICGCEVGGSLFFSTMVEPSDVNLEQHACLYGSPDGVSWQRMLRWKKDRWPMRLFQYGNVLLPDGKNATDLLALTTIAVQPGEFETSIWRLHQASS